MHVDIANTPYCYDNLSQVNFEKLAGRVKAMRINGSLSPNVLYRIRSYFKIKSIYHSNAIEGNQLNIGETREVVEHGLTITGVPLKDQAEARNLSHALDFFEEIASDSTKPITETELRQIHELVLKDISEQAGVYRSVPVAISGSEYNPPGPESVGAEMRDLGSWLSTVSTPNQEKLATVSGLLNAAVAHTWFVTIHPFIDGNGRVARLLMNLMLMRYGFPIAIISKDDRLRYYDTLEQSQATDLSSFIVLITECIEESLEEYEAAAEEEEDRKEWTRTLAGKFSESERLQWENKYEVWKNAMELLKSSLRDIVGSFNHAAGYSARLFFKDFGNLEFEKYSALRAGESAKRTWFLRIDFRQGDKIVARYLFFFGSASYQMRSRLCWVTLHVAREEPMNSYHYERLEDIEAEDIPNIVEVGYAITKERFVIRPKTARPHFSRVEDFGKKFFQQVIDILVKD